MYISNFCSTKTGWFLIFNFKRCNQAVLYRHFKMDTLAAILSLVTPGVYTASIDLEYLKHAYYTIPIAEEQRKFLKFVWNEQLYEFCVLPMGLTSSPRIFTKVMKPCSFGYTLRQKGHINSDFIDDFIFKVRNFRIAQLMYRIVSDFLLVSGCMYTLTNVHCYPPKSS